MSFAIEFFKVLPWQEYFATDFKLVGIITGLQLQWYTLDGDDVIGNIIASGTITARYRTHKAPVFVSE